MHATPPEHTPTTRIAIIGSGPSGCYLAQALLRGVPDVEITIFDRLASPYGLIRYGVAADHQHTKAIIRQFERLFAAPDVRFAGGVNVDGNGAHSGSDIDLAEIRAQYDVVVLATGLSRDRPLGVPGEELAGVFGAGTITRTLNAHPTERPELPSFGTEVVLVGGGNVAVDVLRFLVKDREGYVESDVADHALDPYLARPAERVSVVVRSAAAEMKADPQLLRELAALPRARFHTQDPIPAPAPDADRTVIARLAALAELTSTDRPLFPGPDVMLYFQTVPRAVLGAEQVEAVELASPVEAAAASSSMTTRSGPPVSVPANSVITAIGFVQDASGPLARILGQESESGRIEPGLYRTGWAKRGPRGAIPENRTCAKNVAEEILADLAAGLITPSPERRGFEGLNKQLQHGSVSYAEWVRLDEHERRSAPAGRTRQKLPDRDRMRAIAHGNTLPHE